MRNIFERLFDLQFFAEGVTGEGAGESAAPGETAPVAGEQTTGALTADAGQRQEPSLEELGVPKAKAERFRAIKSRREQAASAVKETAQETAAAPAAEQAAAAETTEAKTEQSEETATGYDWDALMKDPELNRRMQETVKAGKKAVQTRLEAAQSKLDGMTPVIELLGRKYGMDTADIDKLDLKALATAVGEDDYFYEGEAAKMGISTGEAKGFVQRELAQNVRDREISRREAELSSTLEEMMARNFQEKLASDAARLKAQFPAFDLETEMRNPRFAAMVSPSGGWSVADAYWAVHHAEIEKARSAATAQHVAQALSNSVQYGRNMPQENGAKGSAATQFAAKSYREMSAEERAAYKQRLMNDPLARR